jgi:hypothetical protein
MCLRNSTIRASRTTIFSATTVAFGGRVGLRGARLPSGGKIVVLEAEQHGHWSTVATTRARGSKASGTPWRTSAAIRAPSLSA